MSEQAQELIHIEYAQPWKYRWSTGKYIGKTYAETKANKRMVGNQCPECQEIIWPPEPVCPRCKIYTGENWVDVGDTGTVLQYTYQVMPMWDPHLGKAWAHPYPSANIRMDSGCHILHRLEEQDSEKLKTVKRVKAVWKEEGRQGGMDDILYFRAIDD